MSFASEFVAAQAEIIRLENQVKSLWKGHHVLVVAVVCYFAGLITHWVL